MNLHLKTSANGAALMSVKCLLSIFLTAALFTSVHAQAVETDLAASYRRETERLIGVLKASGIKSLGYASPTDVITPDELFVNLQAARIHVDPTFQKPVGSTRRSAFFSRDDATIYLDPSASHPLEVRGVLGLHELFGLRGIPDQNYEFSLLLKLYADRAQTGTDETALTGLQSEIKSYLLRRAQYPSLDHFRSRNPPDNLLLNGSGTLVGGGGDGDGLQLKARLVERVLAEVLPRLPERSRRLPGTFSMLVGMVTNMKIEVDPSISEMVFKVTREEGFADLILVPASMAQDQAIARILKYMDDVNLIPVSLDHVPGGAHAR